jgi:putative FmdB family regulatory protein
MPLYDYRCQRCETRFESFKSMASRDEPEPCPECGESAERLISAVALCGGGGVATGSSRFPSGGG